MDKLKNIFNSKSYRWILWIVAELLLLALVFALGIRVGIHKAGYSYQWGANYERNFTRSFGRPGGPGMMGGGMMGFFRDQGGDLRNAHGLAGVVVSIAGNTLVVKDDSNKENTVTVDDKTIIKAGRNDIKLGDLKTSERIVVIGKPDSSGVIVAELIRAFDTNVTN